MNAFYHGEKTIDKYLSITTRKLNSREILILEDCKSLIFPDNDHVTDDPELNTPNNPDSDIESGRGVAVTATVTTTDPENTTYNDSKFDPFDFRTSKWISGKPVIRINKPIAESNFPTIPKPEIKLNFRTINTSTINVPLNFMCKDTNFFFKVVEYYPNQDIIGLCEMY